MRHKKVVFEVKRKREGEKEEKVLTLCVLTPDLAKLNEAQRHYNIAFNNAISSKAPLRIEVDGLLKERNLWNADKEKELLKTNEEIRQMVERLKKGGMKLSEGRKLAIDIKKKRAQALAISAPSRALDVNTADGQAESARFNYLVSASVYYTDGRPYFKDLNEYLENADEVDVLECAQQFGMLQYNLEPNYEHNLPENLFLRKYGFMNEKLELIDKKTKHLVNFDGKPVNKDGFLVDENENMIDDKGRLVVKLSENAYDYVEKEAKPFIDDDTSKPVNEVEQEKNDGTPQPLPAKSKKIEDKAA